MARLSGGAGLRIDFESLFRRFCDAYQVTMIGGCIHTWG
jgi:hypothetical protein